MGEVLCLHWTKGFGMACKINSDLWDFEIMEILPTVILFQPGNRLRSCNIVTVTLCLPFSYFSPWDTFCLTAHLPLPVSVTQASQAEIWRIHRTETGCHTSSGSKVVKDFGLKCFIFSKYSSPKLKAISGAPLGCHLSARHKLPSL